MIGFENLVLVHGVRHVAGSPMARNREPAVHELVGDLWRESSSIIRL